MPNGRFRRAPICRTAAIRVEFYSGYKADERPLRLWLGEHIFEVAELEDRWYSPGETFFRVRVASGDRYVLRRVDAQEVWTLEGFRAAREPGRD